MSRFRNIPAFSGALCAAAAICLGAIAFGCLTPAPAQAAQWCHTEVGPVGPRGEPGAEFYHCENQPTAAPYHYAAIAVSGYSFSNPSIAWGTTVWAGSEIEAEREALEACRAYGGRDCKVVAWGGNRCLALALSADNASGDNAWAPGIAIIPKRRKQMHLRSAGRMAAKAAPSRLTRVRKMIDELAGQASTDLPSLHCSIDKDERHDRRHSCLDV